MTGRTFIKRSLRFHWRSHLGVVLGAAVATAVLVGALAVGDSVRYSLREMALARVGNIAVAMTSPDRFFREGLAAELLKQSSQDGKPLGARVYFPDRSSSALLVQGVASRPDAEARVNDVQVVGFDGHFFPLFGSSSEPNTQTTDRVAINQRLARALDLKVGDQLVLRLRKPEALPLDAPLSGAASPSIGMTVDVGQILTDQEFGRFSLAANQMPPYNVFIPIKVLQEKLGLSGKANTILIGCGPEVGGVPRPWVRNSPTWMRNWVLPSFLLYERSDWPQVTTEVADAALATSLTPADLDFTLTALPVHREAELRSGRVFIDRPVVTTVSENFPDAIGYLTYFVNEMKVGEKSTPYSMVTAVGPLVPATSAPAEESRPGQAGRGTPGTETLLLPGMKDDEVVINAWLAEDLGAKVGDGMEMSYYVIGSAGRLETQSSRFRIAKIVPLEGPAADPTLMPDFPGLSDVENCRDWHTGFPIDIKKIRDKDEAYWNDHRGTPKAFITLAAGQRMWGNRFGDLTMIRFANMPWPDMMGQAIAKHVNPASLGLYFQPVRERALAASSQGIDFGWLFLGLSLFLVIAALLLTGLLFGLGVEQRAEEIGTLLALGLRPRLVRRLMLAEGAVLALVGGAAGAAAGLAYTKITLFALSTVWSGAVGSSDLFFHADVLTVAGGTAAGFLVALVTIWLTVRRQARAPARELLASGAEAELRPPLVGRTRRWLSAAIIAVTLAGGCGTWAYASVSRGEDAAGLAFGAGALFLIATLVACALFIRPEKVSGTFFGKKKVPDTFSFGGLARLNMARRRGRSLATIALLACGAFLVIVVGANRRDPTYEAALRSSGTGGFALFGETTLPVARDLNSPEGRKAFSLPENFKDFVKFVPLRVHQGDDASCLNLNRAQQPRVLGVPVQALAARSAFTFAEVRQELWRRPAGSSSTGSTNSSTMGATGGLPARAEPPTASGNPWLLLNQPLADGSVPAAADATTLEWALGIGLGDKLTYTDDHGQVFSVMPIAAIQGSILQGSLLISEEEFLRRFPGDSGYRMFLIDVAAGHEKEVSEVLSRQMADVGLAVGPASDRLAAFNSVENTYLAIFQALGGLALALGSIGLGVVVLRNVLERRSELALMRAVGFPRRAIYRLILSEHWMLLVAGLACGLVAGLGAVLPMITSAGTKAPYLSLSVTLGAVLLAGLVWTYLATRLALRGPLLEALRNE
jgi:putative ABC transport system permease protein